MKAGEGRGRGGGGGGEANLSWTLSQRNEGVEELKRATVPKIPSRIF